MDRNINRPGLSRTASDIVPYRAPRSDHHRLQHRPSASALHLKFLDHRVKLEGRSRIALTKYNSPLNITATISISTIPIQHGTRENPTLGNSCSDAPLAAIIGDPLFRVLFRRG